MTAQWRPAPPSQRHQNIDIIRGLALFGVLMINLWASFRVPMLENILHHYPQTSPLNHAVDLLLVGFLDFKALTMFSFLFGVGIAIQFERATARDVSGRVFLMRRFLCLLALGMFHMFLIWNGDILCLYAICGLLLIPFVSLPWSVLTLIGAGFIALQEFASFPLDFPSGATAIAEIARARAVYGSGSALTILNYRVDEAISLVIPILLSVLPRTLGLMFWGLAAWRGGMFRAPSAHPRRFALVLIIGLAVGTPITVNEISKEATGSALLPWLHTPHLDASLWLAMAYVSGLLLWLTPQRALRLPRLAAMGRMALTNYLVQSIVLGIIFFGYGFGQLGRTGSAGGVGIGLAIYLLQLQLSRWWLIRYQFGPFEWLWRSLTYGRRQPLLRESSAPESLSAHNHDRSTGPR